MFFFFDFFAVLRGFVTVFSYRHHGRSCVCVGARVRAVVNLGTIHRRDDAQLQHRAAEGDDSSSVAEAGGYGYDPSAATVLAAGEGGMMRVDKDSGW